MDRNLDQDETKIGGQKVSKNAGIFGEGTCRPGYTKSHFCYRFLTEAEFNRLSASLNCQHMRTPGTGASKSSSPTEQSSMLMPKAGGNRGLVETKQESPGRFV